MVFTSAAPTVPHIPYRKSDTHTRIHNTPEERNWRIHSFIICVLFHFFAILLMRPCKLFTLNIYWILLANINNDEEQIFKLYIKEKEQHAHTPRKSKKIAAINNSRRFVLFLARHLLRRKIWLTYIFSKWIWAQSVVVKDIHFVHKNLNSFPLGFDNKFS